MENVRLGADRSRRDDVILVVDDEEGNRELLSMFFQESGYLVLTASNVKDAYEIFLREQPPLVITDIRMPGGSGLELIKLLNQDIVTRPIIFCVSAFSDLTAPQVFEKGIDLYLHKPFNLKEILSAVDHFLSAHWRVRSMLQQAGERIHTKSRNLSSLFSNVADAVIVAGRDTRVLEVSQSLSVLIGAKREELEGRFLREFSCEEQGDNLDHIFERAFQGESLPATFCFFDKAGKKYSVQMTVNKAMWNKADAFFLVGKTPS